jgi:MFS family permease
MVRKGPHPARFALLMLPFGAAFGFVSFALPVLAVRHGIPEATMGKVVAATFLPHSIKVFWAPVVDTTLDRRLWYLIALVLTALGAVASASMPLGPETLGALTVVLIASQVGLTLMNMAVESFMGLTVPEDEKARASGWYNAAQFVAIGLGGWFALKLASWLSAGWQVGVVYALIMLPCAAGLIGLEVPRTHAERLGDSLRQLGRDLWSLVTSRFGLTGLIIAVSPVGAGAVQNLFQATAGRWGIAPPYEMQLLSWHLNADDILGLFNGLLGAALSGTGAMLGGWLAERVPRRLAYGGAGLALALSGIGMALAPRAPWTFIVFAGLYNFFTGVAFASFTGFVLETIGRGAVATKYNIFASLANVAIGYTTTADSVAMDHGGKLWGTTYMLLTDAGLTFAGITLLAILYFSTRAKSPAA